MANTNKVTRSLALATVSDFIRSNADAFAAFCEHPTDVVAVLDKMRTQIETNATRKANTPTKSQVVNRNLAARVLDAMPDDVWVSSKWIANNVPEVLTTQKAISLTRLLIEDGSAKRGVTEQGRPVFAKVNVSGDPSEDNTLMC